MLTITILKTLQVKQPSSQNAQKSEHNRSPLTSDVNPSSLADELLL